MTIEEINKVLEGLAVGISITAVFLTIKQNVLGWLFGILGCLIYVWIFYTYKLYGNMGLQVVFIINSAIGWYTWKFGAKDKPALPLTILTAKEKMLFPFVILGLTGVVIGIFELTNSNHVYTETQELNYPFILDSFSAGMCLVAQFFLIKKRIQNWLIWSFNDVMCIFLFTSQKLYPTAILYAILSIMAGSAFFAWRKSYQQQTTQK